MNNVHKFSLWSFRVLTGECDFSDNAVGSVLLGVDSVLFSTLDDVIPSAPAKIWDDSARSQQSRKSLAHVKTFSHVLEPYLQAESDSCIKQNSFIVCLCSALLINDQKPHYTALIVSQKAQPFSSNSAMSFTYTSLHLHFPIFEKTTWGLIVITRCVN